MWWIRRHTALGTMKLPSDHRHLGQDPELPSNTLGTHLWRWHTVSQWISGWRQTLAGNRCVKNQPLEGQVIWLW